MRKIPMPSFQFIEMYLYFSYFLWQTTTITVMAIVLVAPSAITIANKRKLHKQNSSNREENEEKLIIGFSESGREGRCKPYRKCTQYSFLSSLK